MDTTPVALPAPAGTLHPLLLARRSTKAFAGQPLSLPEVAAALWAVAGTTRDGHRVTPSARATYPMTATLVSAATTGLPAGAYRYDPASHALTDVCAGDHRATLANLTLDAPWLATCPAALLLSADLVAARSRFPDQPPEHGERFIWVELGHAAQNLYLWAADRGLGTVLLAGLDDDRAASTMPPLLPAGHQLLGVLPIGQATWQGGSDPAPRLDRS